MFMCTFGLGQATRARSCLWAINLMPGPCLDLSKLCCVGAHEHSQWQLLAQLKETEIHSFGPTCCLRCFLNSVNLNVTISINPQAIQSHAPFGQTMVQHICFKLLLCPKFV